MRKLLLASLLFTSVAYADPPKPATQMHVDDCAQARKHEKTCVIDMGKGDTIDGGRITATGTGIGVIQTGKEPSLIRIRRDFIVEIIKSAEDL